MRNAFLLLSFVAAGCGGDMMVDPDGGGADTGGVDGGRLDAGTSDSGVGDGGAGDSGVGDGGVDAPTDVGPPPLIEAIDDGTVSPPHDHTDCAPTVAFAADGTAYLLHVNVPAAPGVRVERLEGRTWAPLGGALNAADQPININICPSMVVTRDGTPYVGFVSASATTRQVRVRRFVSGTWADVLAIDAPISAFAPALDLAMALDESDAPVVALVEFVGDEHFVTVRRLVGSTFVQEGPALERASRNVRVATRPDGTIVVFYTTQVPGLIARVSTLSGGTWTTLPTVDGGGGTPLLVDDVFADAASITVAYSILVPGGFTVRTARSTGAAFSSLGTETLGIRSSTVILGGGRLVQAYERDVAASDVRAYDGTAWGTPITLPVSSAGTRLAVSPDGLFAAYTDGAVARVVALNLP